MEYTEEKMKELHVIYLDGDIVGTREDWIDGAKLASSTGGKLQTFKAEDFPIHYIDSATMIADVEKITEALKSAEDWGQVNQAVANLNNSVATWLQL